VTMAVTVEVEVMVTMIVTVAVIVIVTIGLHLYFRVAGWGKKSGLQSENRGFGASFRLELKN
jgi:hypothetical protein